MDDGFKVTKSTGMKGPAVFLAQFVGTKAPYNTLRGLARWAAGHGYTGIQIPTWEASLLDLSKAAASKDYCDEISGVCLEEGVRISELSTHLQGQLIAVHPAYDELFDGFAPQGVRGRPDARRQWAHEQLTFAAAASQHLGLSAHATFSGALLWPTVYPWPQRTEGLVEEGFKELANRWRPLLDCFNEAGVDLCYEIHPGEDLHDGASFELFLEAVDHHPRANILYDPSHFVLQQLDYLDFIDLYHDRIRMFHVKDAEFRPNGRTGVYGGYQPWRNRAGRFRSLGDGQVDFRQVFSKLTHQGYRGWAVLEWECYLKDAEQGAAEGARFIADHLITVTDRAFDDFAGSELDAARNRRILGLDAS